MNSKLTFASGLAQVSLGTAIAVVPSTHYIQVSEFETEHNQMMDTIPILSGLFTTEPQVVGNLNTTFKGKIPLLSAGVETVPAADLFLKIGGFTATIDATPVGGSKYIYTRSLNQTDASFCKYHCQGTSAIVHSINSAMAAALKITLETGKVPMLDFSGPALAGGASAVEYKAIVSNLTKPTQTKVTYYKVNDVSATVLDTAYTICKADIDITNKIVHKPLMTGNGFGAPEITDESAKMNFSVLMDTSLATLPLNRIRSSITPGSFSITFGHITGQKVTISSTKAQLQVTKDSKQGDLLSDDVSGEFIDNDLVITFNSDLT